MSSHQPGSVCSQAVLHHSKAEVDLCAFARPGGVASCPEDGGNLNCIIAAAQSGPCHDHMSTVGIEF